MLFALICLGNIFFFQAEDGIRDLYVTGVQTCALPIFGAFAAGLILSETNQVRLIEERIRPVADVFTPIFFLSIGAAVDLRVWNPFVAANHETLAIAGVLLVIAVIGKVASGWAVPWRRFNRRAVGIGMAPRGEVGLIFAQIGLGAGILSNRLFSAILFVVVATTLVTPPLLKWALKKGVTLDREEGREHR